MRYSYSGIYRRLINPFIRFFTNLYRYPFKLVIRPRREIFNEYQHVRHSPPGFNPEDSLLHEKAKVKHPIVKYDLYLEPDSLQLLSWTILGLLTVSILLISIYSPDVNIKNNCFYSLTKSIDCSFFVKIISPSLVFFLSYGLMMFFIRYHYKGYPLFTKSWSKKTNCYEEWFYQVPQAIYLSRKDKNKHYISKVTDKKNIIHKKSNQALYYAWNTGSPQKSMWLLSIEETMNRWEMDGIFKKNTSLVVILSPIWMAYLSLIFLLVYVDFVQLTLLKNLYVPVISWVLLSSAYLLTIYMFILERNRDDKITSNQINKFIPYELRSINERHPEIYKRFGEKSFVAFFNFLFVALLIFYITVLSLVK